MSTNRNTAVVNLAWRFFESCGTQIVSFVVSIILARLLDPSVYGVIVLVNVFIAILNVFIASGMSTALIQKKDSDDLDACSLFYFNIFMCIVLYTGLFFAAPLIADFYQNPDLVLITRVLGLSMVISALGVVQRANISKKLLFKKTFFATLASTVVSAVVGISMAYAGFGVWALIFQSLASSFCSTLIIWIIVPWRPKLMFSLSRLKRLFSFGWKMLVTALIEVVYNDLSSLVIGKKYSSTDLAYYNKGQSFPSIIITNVNTSIDSILLPIMAKEQEDKSVLKLMTRRAIKTSTYVMGPLLIGLAVCGNTIVRLLLTEKWLSCVFFMQVFCIIYLFWPIHTANLNAIKAMGRGDLCLKLQILKKSIGVIAILISMWISVEAMAISMLVTTLISTIINAFPNKKLLNYSWFEQMRDLLPNILTACLMAVPVLFLGFLPLPDILVLLIQVATGGIVYFLLSLLFKLESFRYVFETAKGFIKRKGTK